MRLFGGEPRFQGNWIKEHSLSLVVGSIFLGLMLGAYLTQSWADSSNDRLVWWNSTLHGLRDDAFGALLIILGSKWFYERGSAESK